MRDESIEAQNRKEIMAFYGYRGLLGRVRFLWRMTLSRSLQLLAYFAPHPKWAVWCHRLRGVRIGKHVYIGMGVIMDILYPSLITIEDHVTIGAGSMILAHRQPGYSVELKRLGYYTTRVAPTTIKSNAWVAVRCVILEGVTVGECSVVGAGSVVTKDVEPFTVVAGNPAKVIKRFRSQDVGAV